jgi:hypothetical protein
VSAGVGTAAGWVAAASSGAIDGGAAGTGGCTAGTTGASGAGRGAGTSGAACRGDCCAFAGGFAGALPPTLAGVLAVTVRWVAELPRAPALLEHTGQAPQPCPASTFSATAICSSRLARLAEEANWLPPKLRQVDGVNCSPPWNPFPVLMAQLPPLSHWATRSHTLSGAADA